MLLDIKQSMEGFPRKRKFSSSDSDSSVVDFESIANLIDSRFLEIIKLQKNLMECLDTFTRRDLETRIEEIALRRLEAENTKKMLEILSNK